MSSVGFRTPDPHTKSCLRGTCSTGPLYEWGLFGALGDSTDTGHTDLNTLLGFSGLGSGALLGAFVDASGNVKQALPIGAGGTWTAPAGTTAIQFGISDGGGNWLDNYGAFVLGVSSTGAASSLDPYAISTAPIIYKPKLSTRDLYNGVKAVYISPLNSWQRGDAPPMALDPDRGYSSDAYLAEDGGTRRWLNTELPFTTSVATAQRLSKIALMRSRMQGQATFGWNMAGYLLAPLSIVQMTIPELNWVRKQMEVSTVRFTLDKQNEVLTMRLNGASINSWINYHSHFVIML